MSHLTSTAARVAIVTVRKDGARTVHLTEHWNGTYVDARVHVARYIASNSLTRVGYSDTEHLFRDGEHVGRYTITRS
jgi:hypothetical protein